MTAQAQQAASIPDLSDHGPVRWEAKVEEVQPKEGKKLEGIPFLKWTKETVEVETTAFLHYTNIQGKFTEKVSQATLNSKQMPVKEDGTFDIHFGFPSTAKTFVITAIDSKNRTYRMQYKINPVDHQEVILEKIAPHRWRFSAGAGLTRLSFRQRNVNAFNQWAVTLKGSATYRLVPDKLDLGFSSFFNAIPFSTTSTAGYKIQYIGVNGRIGWNLISSNPIRVNINAGLYFNTSLSTIGFANMYGPQLYPEFIYIFDNGNSLILYGKYSPALSQSLSISFAANREVAVGVHYSFPITFSNRMSVGFDMSQLSLTTTTPVNDWASTNTYSLSAGISF